eukprot:COSAG06_NODE_1712_length_8632_cov_71.258409_4_plen_153_part_00
MVTCAGCEERRRLCCETPAERRTGERRRRRAARALMRWFCGKTEVAAERGSGSWRLRPKTMAVKTARGDGERAIARAHEASSPPVARASGSRCVPQLRARDAAAAGAPASPVRGAQGVRCGENRLLWARRAAEACGGDARRGVARDAPSGLQ